MSTEPPPVEETLGGELGRAMAADPVPGAVPTPEWAPLDEGAPDDDDPLPSSQAETPEPHWDPVAPAA